MAGNSVPTPFGVPLANFPELKDFNFYPWTNWQGLFEGWFCPRISFGPNVQDQPVEQYVVDNVGSYGKQLNRVIDALSVLVDRLDPKALSEDEHYAVLKFKELARLADKAAADFQGKPRSGAGRPDAPSS